MDCGVPDDKTIGSKIVSKRLVIAKLVVQPGWRGFRIKRAYGKNRIPSEKRMPKARVKYGRNRTTIFHTKQKSRPLVSSGLPHQKRVGESGDNRRISSETSDSRWIGETENGMENPVYPPWTHGSSGPSTALSSEVSDYQYGAYGTRRDSSNERESDGHDSYYDSKRKFYRHRRKKVLSSISEYHEYQNYIIPEEDSDDQIPNRLEVSPPHSQELSSEPEPENNQEKLYTDLKSQDSNNPYSSPKNSANTVITSPKHNRLQDEDDSDLTDTQFENFYNDLINERTPDKTMTREQALAKLKMYPDERPEYKPGRGWVKHSLKNKKHPVLVIPKKKLHKRNKPKKSKPDPPEIEIERLVLVSSANSICGSSPKSALDALEGIDELGDEKLDLIPEDIRPKKRVTFADMDQIYYHIYPASPPSTPPEVKERARLKALEDEQLQILREFFELGDGKNRPPWKDHCAFDKNSCYRKFEFTKPKDWYDKPRYTFKPMPDPKKQPNYLTFYERSQKAYHEEVRRLTKIAQDNLVLCARCRAVKSHYKYSRRNEPDIRTIAINFRKKMKRFYIRNRLKVDFYEYLDRRPFRREKQKQDANPLATVLKFVSMNKKRPSRKLLESIIGQVMNTNNIQFTRIQDKYEKTPPPTPAPTVSDDFPVIPPACRFYPAPRRPRRRHHHRRRNRR